MFCLLFDSFHLPQIVGEKKKKKATNPFPTRCSKEWKPPCNAQRPCCQHPAARGAAGEESSSGAGGAAAASPAKARPGLAPATPRTAGNCPGHAVPHTVLSRCCHLTCRASYEIISVFGGKNKYLIVVMAIICIQMFSRVRIPQ